LEWRERVRLYKSLVDQRLVWTQRIHAELFQHGVAVPEAQIRSTATRACLAGDDVQLTPAARQRIRVGYTMIDATDTEARPLKEQLQRFGTRQPACRALVDAHYGIGGLLAVAVWSELGDCRRFSRSQQVVRHTGLDVTVDASDLRRAGGFLSRQGPATLRWALFEAAHNASRSGSPDHAYYSAVKDRHDGKLAAISVARQFARRCYPHLAQPRPRPRLQHPQLTSAGGDGWDSPRRHHGSLPRSAPAARLPASRRAGRPYNTDATASPHPWGTPKSRLLSPTT
jgi:transposase